MPNQCPGANPVCALLFGITHNATVARASGDLVVHSARVFGIVVGALLLTRLVRRAIRSFVRSVQDERVQRGWAAVREHTPDVLQRTAAIETTPRSVQRAETMGAVLKSLSSVVIWSVAALMILGEFGMNLGPLIAGAGIVGVAIGFGAQNLVKDFISGMFMLLEDQYGVGDMIDVGPCSGVVEQVTLRTTRLRDVEGTVWHVPNGRIDRVANRSQQWSRALVDIPVAPTTDIDHATRVIKDVARKLPGESAWRRKILEEPEIWGVEDVGPDGVMIRVVVKTTPEAQWEVGRELRRRIKMAFDHEGIDIAFGRSVVLERAATKQ